MALSACSLASASALSLASSSSFSTKRFSFSLLTASLCFSASSLGMRFAVLPGDLPAATADTTHVPAAFVMEIVPACGADARSVTLLIHCLVEPPQGPGSDCLADTEPAWQMGCSDNRRVEAMAKQLESVCMLQHVGYTICTGTVHTCPCAVLRMRVVQEVEKADCSCIDALYYNSTLVPGNGKASRSNLGMDADTVPLPVNTQVHFRRRRQEGHSFVSWKWLVISAAACISSRPFAAILECHKPC